MTEKVTSKPSFRAKKFKDADAAYDYITDIYCKNVSYLRYCFNCFAQDSLTLHKRVNACYPYVKIKTTKVAGKNSRLSYGYLSTPGTYSATLTRPDIFHHYYRQQFEILLENHSESQLEVGVSQTPIPIHFALDETEHPEGNLTQERLAQLPNLFDLPNLEVMDETIANGTYPPSKDDIKPLSLFQAPRIDISLQRIQHYTGTLPEHFQNFVIFTNYQFYIDQFVAMARDIMSEAVDPDIKRYRSEYFSFIEPGNHEVLNQNLHNGARIDPAPPLSRMPQMPAYHLKRPDNMGITMVNIGIGPSNAKTITDHIAVLRPHAWLMLGHCAGLRNSQNLGDYVLAHAYLRQDHVLDRDIPNSIPVPPLAEIQVALQESVKEVSGLPDYDVKRIMRTGTVATIDDRNWEFKEHRHIIQQLSQARAVALDMESATIATNGFRFRVPYGTLLCVSDKPLHGQLKLPGMADDFYRRRVEQHLKIGVRTMEVLRKQGVDRLHSRKLRSFNEVAFQ